MSWRLGTTSVAVLTTVVGVATTPTTAHAFDSKGHNVIEALVYRTLIEGNGSEPARPEVLRDLINDGALVRPICFGDVGETSEECRRASVENPLLGWPEPRTDRPDANFRRQFSDPGQCFHFMGTAEDERSVPLPQGHTPRALATTAIARCRSLLDELLRQIVIVGGRGTRESGYGLYELMHAVGDSFSHAHAERRADTHAIEFLRVWEPGAKLAGSRLGAYYSLSPTRHDADEPRDRAYVRNFAEVGGRPCRDLTGVPYAVPLECLSDDGELARQALVELLVITRDLRVARLASLQGTPATSAPEPETTEAWRQYKEKWFSPAQPCQGEECTAKQPAERAVSSDAFVGVGTRYDPGRSRVTVLASALWLRWSQELNPFIYGIGAAAGYRHSSGVDQGIAEVGFITALPVGSRGSVGVTPIALRVPFGNDRGPELVSQLLRIDFVPTTGTWLSLLGPAEVDWLRVRLDWSVGVAVGIIPGSGQVGGGALIENPTERGERRDETWSPEPLWYGRLKGRRASIFAVGDVTPIPTPSTVASSDVVFGMAGLGASIMWGRDPWNRSLPTAYGASLGLGVRRTTLDNRYLALALAPEVRWYFLAPLGLSLVPVRIEAGPRISGDSAAETSGDVSGKFFFQPGTRLGLAFPAGIVDFLVQAPTLAWRHAPFEDGEILSVRVGIRIH